MGKRFEDAASAPGRPLDHAAIDEEQQHGRPFRQRRFRPEIGPDQVVLEMESGVSGGFFEEGEAVLVVTVRRIMGQSAGPVASHFIDE